MQCIAPGAALLQGVAEWIIKTAFDHDVFWQPMDALRDKNPPEALWQGGQVPWEQC